MEAEQVDINEALGLGQTEPKEEEIKEEIKEEEIKEEENQLSEVERQAFEDGWRPKEEWKGNPDNWKSAEHYVEWGEMKSNQRNMQNRMKQMEKSHNEQMENLNKFNRASTEAKLNDLQNKLNKAVEDGDTDAATAITKETIEVASNANPVVQRETQADESELMDDWLGNNAWFFDKSDPKSAYADNAYHRATRQGLLGKDRLDFVDKAIETNYSKAPARKVNQNRNQASDYSSSGGKAPKGGKQKLTMSDCTPQELQLREVFATDEKFLESVQNSRKGV